MEEIKILVPNEASGRRLDAFVSEFLPELSRSRVQQLILSGDLLLEGEKPSKNLRLKGGEELTLLMPEPELAEAIPQNIPLDVVYEDEDLLVVNKPKGMVVHPAAGHPDQTLVNALLYHCKESLSGIGGVQRPGIVHRIDKDTSGLLLVAKNDFTHQRLAERIKEHDFDREYRCIAYGKFPEAEMTICKNIGRSKNDRKKMAVCPAGEGREATTHLKVLEEIGGFSYVSCKLETGRTHQIRVHLASLGHPLAGDVVYGPKKCITELKGQCLHAAKLGFVHPRSGEYLSFEAPLPDWFCSFLEKLRKTGGRI